jgi:hypothetical protein
MVASTGLIVALALVVVMIAFVVVSARVILHFLPGAIVTSITAPILLIIYIGLWILALDAGATQLAPILILPLVLIPLIRGRQLAELRPRH